MLRSIFWIEPKYIVKTKSDSLLHIQTDTIRSLWYIVIWIIVFLFFPQEMKVKIGFALFIFLLWTFERDWIIDKTQNRITRYSMFLFLKLFTRKYELNDVNRIIIKQARMARGNIIFRLILATQNGVRINVTERSKQDRFNNIIHDLKSMLGPSITIEFEPLEK